jgi:hypothetical protein
MRNAAAVREETADRNRLRGLLTRILNLALSRRSPLYISAEKRSKKGGTPPTTASIAEFRGLQEPR